MELGQKLVYTGVGMFTESATKGLEPWSMNVDLSPIFMGGSLKPGSIGVDIAPGWALSLSLQALARPSDGLGAWNP